MKKFLLILFILSLSEIYAENNSIAVLNLEAKNIETEKADLISERISIELFKSGQYKVIEREKLAQITKEQQLQLSGLTGTEYAARLGEILSAQQLLLGSLYFIDSQFIINIRILDVGSGEYIKVADQQAKDFSTLYSSIPGLIQTLIQSTGTDTGSRFNLEESIQFAKKNIAEGLATRIEKISKKIDNQANSGDILGGQSDTSNSSFTPKTHSTAPKKKGPLFDIILDTKYEFTAFDFERFNLSGNYFHTGVSVLYNFNPLFSLGAAGYYAFTLNNFHPSYSMSLAYGGIQGRFTLNIWKIGLSLSMLGGVASVDVSEEVNNLPGSKVPVFHGSVIVLDTKGTLSFIVSPYMSLGLNIDYLWSSYYDPGEDLKALQAGISLIFRL